MASEEQPENVFEVELDGQPDWGIKLSSNLIVLALRADGPFAGKCEIGDQVVNVNETPVKKLQEFEAIALQTAQMRVENDVQLLPPEREKNVTRRDGFSYRLTQIDFQKGCKFGLGIKHYQNRVLVSRVDEGEFPSRPAAHCRSSGSLSARSLQLGDRIVDVNGQPVSDKDVARDMLLMSLKKHRTVTLVIERAESDAAKAATRQALLASEAQPPSQKEVVIATDHEGKVLKHVGPTK
ncbi:Smz-2 [Aphelenchoides fujianensis]|nr:Smz-2 [Aphelenchoides fujianensis]